jgi:fructosamine-3-kinase
MLEAHKTVPSLLHGDLWTGNAGVTSDGEPVIFVGFRVWTFSVPTRCCSYPFVIPLALQDPATYYGDREADLAMTYLFGAFPDTFYEGYEEEWPLPPGFESRRTIYNLYHILNHYVLFGGGYAPQAQRMMDQIMKM